MWTATRIRSLYIPRPVWESGSPRALRLTAPSIPAGEARRIERRFVKNPNTVFEPEQQRYRHMCEAIQRIAWGLLEAGEAHPAALWDGAGGGLPAPGILVATWEAFGRAFIVESETHNRVPLRNFRVSAWFFPPDAGLATLVKYAETLAAQTPAFTKLIAESADRASQEFLMTRATTEDCRRAFAARLEQWRYCQQNDCALVDCLDAGLKGAC